jgi:hypothetical protein
MSHGVLVLLLALGLVGCSTRSGVVEPDAVPTLNDSQWTIKSAPAARPR